MVARRLDHTLQGLAVRGRGRLRLLVDRRESLGHLQPGRRTAASLLAVEQHDRRLLGADPGVSLPLELLLSVQRQGRRAPRHRRPLG